MNAIFKKMVGRDHKAFKSPDETAYFVKAVGFNAPDLDYFYNHKYGNDATGRYTVYDYFMLMADAASGDWGAIGLLIPLSLVFPAFGGYLIENKVFNSKIGDSHGAETYLSWLRVILGA